MMIATDFLADFFDTMAAGGAGSGGSGSGHSHNDLLERVTRPLGAVNAVNAAAANAVEAEAEEQVVEINIRQIGRNDLLDIVKLFQVRELNCVKYFEFLRPVSFSLAASLRFLTIQFSSNFVKRAYWHC